MPTYSYTCSQCHHQMEDFASMSSPPLTKCPQCKEETLIRDLGGKNIFLRQESKSSSCSKGTCLGCCGSCGKG